MAYASPSMAATQPDRGVDRQGQQSNKATAGRITVT